MLDGSLAATSENLVVYATSNRRHLMPEYMQENLETHRVGDEIHPGESVEEKISLSERFGLWVSFHPFRQDAVSRHRALLGRLARRGGEGRGTSSSARRCSGRSDAARAAGALPSSSPGTGPAAAGTAPGAAQRRNVPTEATPPITEVAAAVLIDGIGSLSARAASARKSLRGVLGVSGRQGGGRAKRRGRRCDRELVEELGIAVRTAFPWITLTYQYPHACVRLHFFRVAGWMGNLHPHEGQEVAWQCVDQVDVSPLLPANAPVLRALALPHVYGITRVAQLGQSRFLARLDAALGGGSASDTAAREGLGT